MKTRNRNRGWFRPGQSGNPKGRPRKTKADVKVKIWCPRCKEYEILPLSVSERFPGLRHRCGMWLGPENRVVEEPKRKRRSLTELIERLAAMEPAANQPVTGNEDGRADPGGPATPNAADSSSDVPEEIVLVAIPGRPGVYQRVRAKDVPPGARRYED